MPELPGHCMPLHTARETLGHHLNFECGGVSIATACENSSPLLPGSMNESLDKDVPSPRPMNSAIEIRDVLLK